MTHNKQAIQDKKNVGSLVPNISLAEDGRSHRVVSKTCLMCQQDSVAAKRSGLFQPMPIPARPQVSVLINFVVGFSKDDGMNIVMMVVDMFTKYAKFIVTATLCQAKVVVGFYQNVVKYFRISLDIVNDCDV